MALVRGQVLALRRGGACVLWSIGPTYVEVIPIGGYNGPPPHRAEVRIENPAEVLSCGVSLKYPVVRCQLLFDIKIEAAQLAHVLGMASADLLDRMTRAVRRDTDARAMEARLHFGEKQSNIVRRSGITPVFA